LDCGTIPNFDAIYNCFRAMEGDEQIGGVCGNLLNYHLSKIKVIWV
jgi:cellulose synthase/poly-beta-1,6-N-acetylglucosamine synthase-like glycosyltransferase